MSAKQTQQNQKPYYVYIAKCVDGTLYTGIATDVVKRIREHNGDKMGARYTRGRQPIVLAYQKQCADRSSALKEEISIKRMKRQQKMDLIDKMA